MIGKTDILLVAPLFFLCVQAGLLDDEKKILSEFKKKYNNSVSDLIFMMDVSGSVPMYGFNSEKVFVESLLNEFSVAPYSTRVAVITFGEFVKTDINYIDIDPSDTMKSKCEFKNIFEHRIKHRWGRATNMRDAFQHTINVIKNAKAHNRKRHNVHTVAMMITDGWWNMGDPKYNADTLKNTYSTEVFSVGVGGYREWQLQAVASSSSHVLKFHDFYKFKQLAMYIRGDAHERIYMAVPSDKCTQSSGCDSNAKCTCGTVSGLYQCVCNAGYYGPGTPGQCYKCRKGSYKKFPSPEDCNACPAKSSTAGLGSTNIVDCKCNEGYEGNPSAEKPCLPVQCVPISPPQNGYLVGGACDYKYQSTCEVACNKGYTLHGTATRTCQKTKSWSGTEAYCQIVRCTPLPLLTHGTKSCTGVGNGQYYGEKCSYTCDQGYDRKGSAERTCQLDGTWTGQPTSCVAKLCPALRKLPFGTVEPVDCLTTPQPYTRACVMKCFKGYTFSGSSPLTCGADGEWQGTFPVCTDNQPPVIRCPLPVNSNTDPERNTKRVTWELPVAQDNAELHDPNARPTVTSSEPLITSPYNFPIGTTRLVYTATDKSGQTAQCTFTVKVVDNEPPFIFCPDNMEVPAAKSGPSLVFWQPPHYFDNSKGTVTIFTGHVNGSSFQTGSTTVKYTATDEAGNVGTCSFVILVTKTRCKAYDPPINGAITCQDLAIAGGDYCSAMCNGGKEFSSRPATYYICKTEGFWQIFDWPMPGQEPANDTMPWPDCTEVLDPSGEKKGMEWQYLSGDCSDPNVQQEAKRKFIDGLAAIIGGGDPTFCSWSGACRVANVRVTCGAMQTGRKRGLANTLTIDFDIEVTAKGMTDDERKKKLDEYVNKVKAETQGKLASLNIPGVTSTFYKILKEDLQPSPVCRNGSVYELNKENKKKCMSCPPGNFYDSAQSQCVLCPRDTYEHNTGSLACQKCPSGTYTFKSGTKKGSECKPVCQAGTYSTTGLELCQPCAIGYYQSHKRQTTCNKCPGSTITLEEGADSISKCGMPCAPGTYSATGVEPCAPCPVGTYQPDKTKSECIKCPSPKTTFGTGSVKLSQCVVINFCDSNPCNNGAQCNNMVDGYRCMCKSGFTGKNCEVEEDECTTNPCANGGACVDKINGFVCTCPSGFTGQFCEKATVDCKPGACRNNGKCVEIPGGFQCLCSDGYEGDFCEVNTNECKSSPCLNGGKCTDGVNSFTCNCPAGYSGGRCEDKTNGCRPDSCLNGATCTETSYGHRCACVAGFSGNRCETDINECASTPCANNGLCVDKEGGFTCLCKPGFSGTTCLTAGSTDFDLEFGRAQGRGMAAVNSRQELRAFTVSFWMKSEGSSNNEPGTPISYAVKASGSVLDNALTIHDYNGFNVWINNEKASTNVAANDGKWHHMAFTWKSSTGAWKVYKDGTNVGSSEAAFMKDQAIPAGGVYVLGQEQDIVGGNFSASEAFLGHLSQMNIWNYEIDENEIKEMGQHSDHRQGNVVAWSDFLLKLDSNVRKIQPSASRQANKCWSNWIDRNDPTSSGDSESASDACANSASYDCQTKDGRGLDEVIVTVKCSASGVTCLNSEQKDGRTCPDFKFRAVCNCPATQACTSNTCRNGGKCVNLPLGFKCICPEGFEGRYCETVLNCPNPGSIANGQVRFSRSAQSGSYTSGTVATFTCNSGFTRSGPASSTCRSRKWQGGVTKCLDVNECQMNKCQHSCENFDGGYKCACANGYALRSDGTCTDIDECATNNGNCQHKCYNTAGSYRCMCHSGYALTADKHACQDVNECSDNQGRGNCQHICINGLGTSSCACRSGFKLNSDGRTCKEITCHALAAPANGNSSPTGVTSLDSDVHITCNDGFRLVGSATRTCQSDGLWSGLQPSCVAIKCVMPSAPMYGSIAGSSSSFNSVIKYTCNSGYRVSGGDAQRTCGKDGEWSGSQPRCIAAACPDPVAPAKGLVVGLQRSVGDTVRFECQEGYRVSGKAYSVCQSSGSWDSPTPTCAIVDCGKPPALASGSIVGSVYTYGSKIQYRCIQDWHLSGPAERVCQADGLWSGKAPVCLERSCGNPGNLANGKRTGEDFTYGKVVTFTCNSGHVMSGSSTRTCQTNGKWTGTQPTCDPAICGDPGAPVNGEKTGAFTYGSTLTYDCMPGYKLVGDRQRTCQANAQWTGSQPHCTATSCGALMNGPTGQIQSENFPNGYSDNSYCRWKITVRSDRQVMITFNTLQTQAEKDKIEVYDGQSGELITTLSGVHTKPISITSNSNVMDVRFSSDAKDSAVGFQASYRDVSCGGVVTTLDSTIQSPNFPSYYPLNADCVWVVKPGRAFQLEFASFHTEDSYDFLRGYGSINSNEKSERVFEYSGKWFRMEHFQAPSGVMMLHFHSNWYNSNFNGFQLSVRKYQVIVGKKKREITI